MLCPRHVSADDDDEDEDFEMSDDDLVGEVEDDEDEEGEEDDEGGLGGWAIMVGSMAAGGTVNVLRSDVQNSKDQCHPYGTCHVMGAVNSRIAGLPLMCSRLVVGWRQVHVDRVYNGHGKVQC
jgi:hypothetical protein